MKTPLWIVARQFFSISVKVYLLLFSVVVILFGDVIRESSSGYVGFLVKDIISVLSDPDYQWIILSSVAINIAICFLFRSGTNLKFLQSLNIPCFLLALLLLAMLLIYVCQKLASAEALYLVGGFGMGRAFALWAAHERNGLSAIAYNTVDWLFLWLILILLCLASFNTLSPPGVLYHGEQRWSGPWNSPDIFGLLMGSGVSLAITTCVTMAGLRFGKLRSDVVLGARLRECTIFVLCLIAVILTSRGLVHSYCRGAWFGTFCSLVYLIINDANISHRLLANLTGKYAFVGVIGISILTLGVWHVYWAEWSPLHRAFSSFNNNDFSWRNRIAVWEGDLQIMADSPWVGVRWERSKELYAYYYSEAKIADAASAQTNDYLVLGAALGVPAFMFFFAYLGVSLFPSNMRVGSGLGVQNGCSHLPQKRYWGNIVWRAGAIVLAIGLWFDRGLFKLPTAATFWILLELGREG
jgi:hypothetical protein